MSVSASSTTAAHRAWTQDFRRITRQTIEDELMAYSAASHSYATKKSPRTRLFPSHVPGFSQAHCVSVPLSAEREEYLFRMSIRVSTYKSMRTSFPGDRHAKLLNRTLPRGAHVHQGSSKTATNTPASPGRRQGGKELQTHTLNTAPQRTSTSHPDEPSSTASGPSTARKDLDTARDHGKHIAMDPHTAHCMACRLKADTSDVRAQTAGGGELDGHDSTEAVRALASRWSRHHTASTPRTRSEGWTEPEPSHRQITGGQYNLRMGRKQMDIVAERAAEVRRKNESLNNKTKQSEAVHIPVLSLKGVSSGAASTALDSRVKNSVTDRPRGSRAAPPASPRLSQRHYFRGRTRQ